MGFNSSGDQPAAGRPRKRPAPTPPSAPDDDAAALDHEVGAIRHERGVHSEDVANGRLGFFFGVVAATEQPRRAGDQLGEFVVHLPIAPSVIEGAPHPHAASHPPGENTGGQRELKHAGEQEIGGDRDDERVGGITKRAP